MDQLDLLELLYAAVHNDLGVVVETNDAEFLRQKLYPLRGEDPSFAALSFLISPINGSDLWIIKKGTTSESGTDETHIEPI